MDPSRFEPDPTKFMRLTESLIDQLSASKPRIRTAVDLVPIVSEALDKSFASTRSSSFYGDVVNSFDNIFRVAHDVVREYLPQPTHAPWLRVLNLVPDHDISGDDIRSKSLIPILNVDLGTEELRVMIVSWSDNRPPRTVQEALSAVSTYAILALRIESRNASVYAYILFSASKVIIARYDPTGKCTQHHLVDISQSEGRRTLAKMLIPPIVYNDTRVPILSSGGGGGSGSSPTGSFARDGSKIVLACRRMCENVPSLGIRAPIDYERRVLSSKLVFNIPDRDMGSKRFATQKPPTLTASETLSPLQQRIHAISERRSLRPDKILITESWDTPEDTKRRQEMHKSILETFGADGPFALAVPM